MTIFFFFFYSFTDFVTFFFFPIFGNAIAIICLSIFFFPFHFEYSTHGQTKLGRRNSVSPLPKFNIFSHRLFFSSLSYFWLNFGNGNTEIQSLSSKSQITLNSIYNANSNFTILTQKTPINHTFMFLFSLKFSWYKNLLNFLNLYFLRWLEVGK